jgi:trehalose 6-phosphate phosphatase
MPSATWPVAQRRWASPRKLLRESDVSASLYAGDDTTDLDAFATLGEMVEQGRLQAAICVGVRSEEGPAEVVERADVVLEGPSEVRHMLEALLVE